MTLITMLKLESEMWRIIVSRPVYLVRSMIRLRVVGKPSSLFKEDDRGRGWLVPCERVVDKIKSSCQPISAACMCSGLACGIVLWLLTIN